MLKWLIFIALFITGVFYLALEEILAEEPNQAITLQEPIYQWVPCTCGNNKNPEWPPVMGLSENDFIKHQMWIAGLKHQAKQERRYKKEEHYYSWQWRAACKKAQSQGGNE